MTAWIGFPAGILMWHEIWPNISWRRSRTNRQLLKAAALIVVKELFKLYKS